MRLLLIEDSPRLQQSLDKGLRHAGFALDLTGDGIQGLHFAKTHDYDVIILDLMVPGMDGLTLLKNLRALGNQTHVLILTARDSVDDRVLGLRTGADDYLTKPFAFDELLARVQALARRRHQNKNPIIEVGPLKIDTAARTVSRDDQPIEVAAREYAKPIVARLNDLLSRIEEAFCRERRFTSNVAHELRTPIAELRSLAEVALAFPRTGEDAHDHEETLAIARQMQSLVESLLALARAEISPATLQVHAESLESLLKSALKPYLSAAANSHLDISSTLPTAKSPPTAHSLNRSCEISFPTPSNTPRPIPPSPSPQKYKTSGPGSPSPSETPFTGKLRNSPSCEEFSVFFNPSCYTDRARSFRKRRAFATEPLWPSRSN